MELITTACALGAGVVSCILQNPTSTVANVGIGVVSGMIANPSDRKVCNALRSVTHWLKNAKHDNGLPVNHDMQRAVRRAYLEATRFVCERCLEEELKVPLNLLKRDVRDISRPEVRQIDSLLRIIDKELKRLHDAEYIPPDSAAIQEVELLLQPKNITLEERFDAFKTDMKATVLNELLRWQPDIPHCLTQMMWHGWDSTDWFDVMCAFFNSILKNDERVRAVFQNQILAQLTAQDISIPGELFQNQFEKLAEAALKQRKLTIRIGRMTQEILVRTRGIDEKTDRIDERSLKIDEKTDRIDETAKQILEEVRKPEPEPDEEPEPDYPCMSDDTDSLPPTCKLPKRRGTLLRSINHFVGRIAELWDIHFILKRNHTAVVEGKPGQGGIGLVMGMGGLGKTQLAIEYVHRFGVCYPGGVFWINAEQGMARMIVQLCMDAEIEIDMRKEENEQLTQLWKKMSNLGQVLIVLDNFPETEPLQPWVPPAGEIYMLVTTRRRDLMNYSRICLEILSNEAGTALINSGERDFGAAAQPLAEALGGLPLGLELARNFLNIRKEMSIEKLLGAIQAKGEMEVLTVFAKKYADELPSGHTREVSATIQMSYDLVSDFGRKVMQVMAFLAPTPIPRRLLRDILNTGDDNLDDDLLEDPLDEAVSELENLSLINLDEEKEPFMHRLIGGFVRMTAQKDDETSQSLVKAVLAEMRRVGDDKDMNAYRELDKIVPHADVLTASELTIPEQAAGLSNYLLWHYMKKGVYGLSETYGRQALKIAENHYEPGHKEIATIQSNLATVLQDLGKYEAAEILLREVLESELKIYEPGHPSLAVTQSNLALVLGNLGKYEAAEILLREVLESESKIYEAGHPRLAVTQSNLAMVLQDLGKYEATEILLREVLESMKKNYEPGHPHIAQAQSNLAIVLRALGKYEAAEILLREVVESAKMSYEPGHPQIALYQSNLALVLKDLGKYEAAEILMREVVESAKKSYEPGHPQIALYQSNLATVLRDLGKYEAAEILMREVVESFKKNLGADHPNVATVQHNLATLLKDMGKDDEAIQLEQEAYNIWVACLPAEHPHIKIAKGNLDEWRA